jgi:hypothetical protein
LLVDAFRQFQHDSVESFSGLRCGHCLGNVGEVAALTAKYRDPAHVCVGPTFEDRLPVQEVFGFSI